MVRQLVRNVWTGVFAVRLLCLAAVPGCAGPEVASSLSDDHLRIGRAFSHSRRGDSGFRTDTKTTLGRNTSRPAVPATLAIHDTVVRRLPPARSPVIQLVGHQQPAESLAELIQLAQWQNPRLVRLQAEAAAAQAKIQHVNKLPDPTVGANVFASPIETAAGSQTANLTIMQRFPWLRRLDAQAQQACFEALAIQQVYQAERLKTIADLRAGWCRLFVIARQIEVNQANQQLLDSLIRIANARLEAGDASQGDVLLATLELSRLAQQMLTFRQQQISQVAKLNRIVGRSSNEPITAPAQLNVTLPAWQYSELRRSAIERQPDIAAAVLRADASRWGIEVARLRRRPDVSVGAAWYAIDDDRPASGIVDVGRDAWSVGVQLTVPVWQHKYDAIQQEANERHTAAQATVDEVIQRYEALLQDLWAQAQAASETASLYRTTILPQAQQTLQSDQESYANGGVEFDRVIRDLRNVLTLQLEHHRAVGRLAIALARIRQATADDSTG